MPNKAIAVEQAVLHAVRCWEGASVETVTKAALEAVPDGWAKIDGRWQRLELVVDQWGRKDAEGNPAPASYVKPPVYRIEQVTDG